MIRGSPPDVPAMSVGSDYTDERLYSSVGKLNLFFLMRISTGKIRINSNFVYTLLSQGLPIVATGNK